MPASVVPPKHARRQSPCRKEAENAFNIADTSGVVFVVLIAIDAGHLGKECRGRELARITNDNHLLCPGDGTERIDGLNLTRLIHHKQIELHSTGGRELRNGQRAHHENGLQRSKCRRGLFNQLPDSHVSFLSLDFASKNAQRPNRPAIPNRHTLMVDLYDLDRGGYDPLTIQVGELPHQPSVCYAVEAAEGRRDAYHASIGHFVIGHLEGIEDVLRREAAVSKATYNVRA